MIKLSDCPAYILQHEGEFNELMKIYIAAVPKVVVEIGSFYGGTLWHWIKHNANLKTLTSIDYEIGRRDPRFNEMRNSKMMWDGWLKESAGLTKFNEISGDSHSENILAEVYRLHPSRDVDFLFIDGDHSTKGIRADFENYSGIVKPGGLIVLHDVISIKSVNKYWRQLKKKYPYVEIFGGKGAYGFGIIKK